MCAAGSHRLPATGRRKYSDLRSLLPQRIAGNKCLDKHLAALGIPAEEFEKVGVIKTLCPAAPNPWLALSCGGNPDYSAAFADVLKQAIRSSVGMISG